MGIQTVVFVTKNHCWLNPLSPNSIQDQFSPYNYPYTVKR